MSANFSCSLCDHPSLLFCPICDQIYCDSCAEEHSRKSAEHECENLEARSLLRAMGKKDFQVRRTTVAQAKSVLTEMEERANGTIQAVREGLERAYLQNVEMIETVRSGLKDVLQHAKKDLGKAWQAVHPLFDSPLTERVLSGLNETPDVFEATETFLHITAVVETTATFYSYFREADLEGLGHKILSLLRPQPELPVSELENAVNVFLQREYLSSHSTPLAEVTLKSRLPISAPRSLALSLPYCEAEVTGGRYFGQVNIEGVPDGYGALIMVHDGSKAYTFRNGDVYVGEMSAGQITGQGLMVHADGTLYEGQWECAERSGRGVLQWPDGSRYEGDLLRGQRHGQGCLVYSDGSKYEGGWLRDKRHHWGVYTKGRTRCEGEWQADSLVEAGLVAGFYPSA